MKAVVASMVFLCFATLAFGQAENSTVFEDSVVNYEAYYENDSAFSSSTYTQNPGDLAATKDNRNQSYTERKFSKTEWKRIVGETNYTEDPTKEPEAKENTYRPRSVAWNPALLKIIGYAVIILLIGAVIYYLLKNAMQHEGTAQKTITGNSILYTNQHIDEINDDDIERLLREALERSDFRAAVRLYYIRLLKHLHSGGYIAWKKDKTNRDYAAELSAFPFTREFRKLMLAYEIIWYGDRTPSAEEFRTLQGNFNDLQNKATRPA